jgi:hypothetical protein
MYCWGVRRFVCPASICTSDRGYLPRRVSDEGPSSTAADFLINRLGMKD